MRIATSIAALFSATMLIAQTSQIIELQPEFCWKPEKVQKLEPIASELHFLGQIGPVPEPVAKPVSELVVYNRGLDRKVMTADEVRTDVVVFSKNMDRKAKPKQVEVSALQVVPPVILPVQRFELDIPQAADITMFPNPVESVMNFTAELAGSEMATIQIYDMVGNVVRSILVDDSSRIGSVDLSDLESGVYVITMVTDKDEIARKFIKQ